MDGLTLLGQLRQRRPDALVVIMTAHGTMETAVAAMQQGAYDYLAKPFDIDEALLLAERALTARRLTQEVASLKNGPQGGVGVRRPGGPASDDAGGLQDHRAGGRERRERPPPRRVGHGQGSGGARAPPLQPARGAALRGDLGGGDPGHAPGVRALRPREGRLHRRQGAAARQARARARRQRLLRRDRRHAARAAGQAAARAPGARLRARGRPRADPHGRARARRHPPRPRGHDEGGAVPRGPLLPAQRGVALAARPPRAPPGHPPPRRALPRQVRRVASASASSRPRRWTGWSATTGPGTCGSSRT